MSDERSTITFGHMASQYGAGHGYRIGDCVTVYSGSRWREIRLLLARPRVQVVAAITATTMDLESRRMTWREWFRALWRAVKP